MFLFRRLSSESVAKKAPILHVVVVSLLAQSCTAISGLSQRGDQSNELPQVSNETTSGDASVRKVSVERDVRTTSKRAAKHALNGIASWYGPGFHGKKTASGEIYDQNKLTAAHKTVPLGTKARVTNLENGSTVEVEINDRGPFVEGRIIDLSRAAARALGFVKLGTAPVQVELIPEFGMAETASN
ncbi:MAG TPA: septal ring lytic transglycosylase RlpA family protein [Candidatus Binatia bacterium]|nr:septal ring lytic transglycosylase RlpA family protein [Candidatus Binatia bacterium]